MDAATALPAPGAPRRRLPLAAPERLLLVLLAFIPLAALAAWLDWGAVTVFAFAGLAIVPLAGLMGGATERLSARLGPGVGGLVQATFGNAAELILAIVLFAAYLLSLVFSLKTHRHLYAGQAHAAPAPAGPAPSVGRAAVTLAIATALVAWMSELLVGAVEETAAVAGVSEVFVGV